VIYDKRDEFATPHALPSCREAQPTTSKRRVVQHSNAVAEWSRLVMSAIFGTSVRRSTVRSTCDSDRISTGLAHYSTTSSAIASSFGDNSMPKAFAVLRMRTNSNLVGCCTGRSPGCAPLSTLPARMKRGVGSLAHQACERRIDLAAGAGVENLDLHSHGSGSRLHISCRGLGREGVGRIDEYGHAGGSGHQRPQQFHPLRRQLTRKEIETVRLPPGRARLAARPRLTVSSPTTNTMGIKANEVGYERRHLLNLMVGPAVFDRHVLALDVAGFNPACACCSSQRAILKTPALPALVPTFRLTRNVQIT
jgi:hypothetical protein